LIGGRLSLHGVEARMVTRARLSAATQTFRAKQAQFEPEPVEGRTRVTLDGDWAPEVMDVAAGSIFVPIAQAKQRLVMALLEPRAPDSFAAWGFFNACFERKEYMEDYVAEQVAEEMLRADPSLAEDFRLRLARDPAFAASPQARLDYFYQRHASWDAHYGLYPILRVDSFD
jgi:hypothetical protein